MDTSDLAGRAVVITGGAQGIGLCLVHTFARRGAGVAFCDVKANAGRHWERRLSDEGRNVAFFRAELGREADARKFARAALATFGRIDILINNVGIADFGRPFLRRPPSEWSRMISVNLTSYWLCSQLFAPALIKSRGSIVNIASTRALMSEPDTEPYSVSKGESSRSPTRWRLPSAREACESIASARDGSTPPNGR